ncbi:MAG: sugar ABC transporter substrate-binding protein [Clostridia bacterium]|nr:sugar ABC transporter substrate-binding protein [Clostridia bacterium]
MKKKYSVLVELLLIAALFLGACTGGANNQSQQEEKKDENVTLSFIHWRGEDTEAFNEIIAKFEAENPNIKIQMNSYPSKQYEATLTTKLKDGGAGDVFAMFPGVNFAAVTEAGLAEDLTNEPFVERFQEHLIAAGNLNGKQYGLPYQLVFNMPIYNKTMFDQLGLEKPHDWESFLEVCEKLKQHGVIPIIFPAADNGPGQFMNPMVMNNAPDEDIFIKLQNGEVKATDEWWVKTLSQIKELNDKGYFGKDPLGTTQDASAPIMAQEKGAMIAMGSYMMAQVAAQNPNIEIDILAPYTVPESERVWDGIHTTTFMLAVNSQSKHKEEAKKFIEFLSRPEIASIYANKTGQHLTIKDVNYESKVLKDTIYWAEKKTRFQPRFTLTNPQVQEALLSSIQDVLGGTSPEKAAEQAQKIIDQAIKK